MKMISFFLAFCFISCDRPLIQQNNTLPNSPSVAIKVTPQAPEPIGNPAPTPPKANEPIIALPPAPKITKAGHDLITSFEGFDFHPAWAGGASGVDVGYGYDMGYYSKSIILSDWYELRKDWSIRLSDQSGITGQLAHSKINMLRDILVDKGIGTRVFDIVDIGREYANCQRAFPGFESLRPNAQAALISLSFNRGIGMVGNSRLEMRNIRALVPKQDYSGIASEFRKMVRVWVGTDIYNGMKRRRFAEADLIELR